MNGLGRVHSNFLRHFIRVFNMEHFYTEVEGWFNYEALYSNAVNWAQNGAHFVEVGSWKGKSAAYMCVEIINSGKTINFDCVDTFKGSLDEDVHQNDPDVVEDRLMEVFIENMKPVDGYYNVIKEIGRAHV